MASWCFRGLLPHGCTRVAKPADTDSPDSLQEREEGEFACASVYVRCVCVCVCVCGVYLDVRTWRLCVVYVVLVYRRVYTLCALCRCAHALCVARVMYMWVAWAVRCVCGICRIWRVWCLRRVAVWALGVG